MSLTDIEMDLLLAKAEVATLKREAQGNMFTVPNDYVKVVRCRDCVHGKQVQLVNGTAAYHCKIHSEDPFFLGMDYCSSGERKDGDNHG